jgi:HEAT repeat protein
MTARKKIFASVALLALVGGVAWELLRSRVPDPIYEGKHLSYWLAHPPAPVMGPGDSIDNEEVDETAVRHIGTNAIPLLLTYMSARDSRIKTAMIKLMRSRHFVKFGKLFTDEDRHSQAAAGFEVLGSMGLGQSAVPELMRIYKLNLSLRSQAYVVQALGSIGSGAKDSLPLLIEATTNSDVWLRQCSLRALGRMSCEPDVVVPVLARALNDPVPYIRLVAVQSLSNFGPQAKEAIPGLFELRRDQPPDSKLKIVREIDRALTNIDPEAATKAGIQ